MIRLMKSLGLGLCHRRQPFFKVRINKQMCMLLQYQSSYIQKIRLIQSLKDNNNVPNEILQKACFALFFNFKPLVAEKQGGGYCIPWKRFNDISKLLRGLQLVLLTTDSCTGNNTVNTPDEVSFAINIPSDKTLENEELTVFATEMRKAMFIMSQRDTDALVQGYGLLKWHSVNNFCPNCGTKTNSDVVGSKRKCEACTQVNYPKMAPIIITLVTDEDKCLVIRQPTFPRGMFSALAGFCEIGETLEMSTRREVAEEVGLIVQHVQYQQSQHWPFPNSGLMLGCYATIKPDTAHKMSLDENELEDAKWLSRDEVKYILQSNTRSEPAKPSIWFPPSSAIAHHLIKNWAFDSKADASS
ncbi:NAD(P)H pyrophosphatase NUDT13, mitochondrial-like [Antedon mediterranea]|uniref:NAD(P)H pyrophosphatase NUDT13, mitochondrial-like n=1 Tax=Antedon mediterranea TaxID=105859 RepID=UPI003AF765B3